jgi:hypothetical protein
MAEPAGDLVGGPGLAAEEPASLRRPCRSSDHWISTLRDKAVRRCSEIVLVIVAFM